MATKVKVNVEIVLQTNGETLSESEAIRIVDARLHHPSDMEMLRKGQFPSISRVWTSNWRTREDRY